ncbi:MAG: PD-(D/E)XK nuclease family protein [Desulfovibrio sp.]|jgi:hypothetical protein|nr:PD-(D/E)XK nuclease family protein [Desulfovibrio sp.]
MKRPFILIPWERNFLRDLLDFALEDCRGDLSRAFFVFPHVRPARYLTLLIREDRRVRKPLIMPRTLAVRDLCAELFDLIEPGMPREAALPDLIALLLNIARERPDGERPGFSPDASAFFPWGVRLAGLFEECFSQCAAPENFFSFATGEDHEDGLFTQPSSFPASLLARLGHIFSGYRAALRKEGFCTTGYMAGACAEYVQKHKALPKHFPSGFILSDSNRSSRLYLAGFHTLTRAENIIFRRLAEDLEARVVIQADAAIAGATNASGAHWSCLPFLDWAKDWACRVDLFPGRGDTKHRPEIRYIAGYDLHSQLRILKEELAHNRDACPGKDEEPSTNTETTGKTGDDPGAYQAAAMEPARPGSFPADGTKRHLDEYTDPSVFPEEILEDLPADTAVILPSGDMLPAVLHHLPNTDVNISLGYPLARSPLFRLLDTVARLREKARDGLYYWRDLVDLLRHPYVKMLSTGGPDPDDDEDFSRMLRRLDQGIRNQRRKFADPCALLEETRQLLAPEETPSKAVFSLLDELFAVTLDSFRGLACPDDLAQALEGLYRLMDKRGAEVKRRFPIDAECLYRLRFSLLPSLRNSGLSREKFTEPALFALLRSLLDAERVPFEAEPLVGLQVIGLLESRLLSFRRVIILDAVEQSLPGSPVGDPLLPDSLRPELGLPSPHSRETISAYNFFRLIQGAEKVVLLWQEGEEAGLQGGRKKKSRFIEELLWAEEQKLGRLLTDGEDSGALRVLTAKIQPPSVRSRSIEVDEPVRSLMQSLFLRSISATLLDDYMRCPAGFFYTRLARITPPTQAVEDDDPQAIGVLWHNVLRDFYSGRLNRFLDAGRAWSRKDRALLRKAFFSSPVYADLSQSLPADSAAMLIAAAKTRMDAYVDGQPPTKVLAVECPLFASLEAPGATLPMNGVFSLAGRVDRLDQRAETGQEDAVFILDYKTGRLPALSEEIWADDPLWKRLDDWEPGEEEGKASLLAEVAQKLQSIQLPFYLLLYFLARRQETLPAALSATRLPALNAAWVGLADTGKEQFLFPENFSREEICGIIENRLPKLLDFLLRHMLTNRRIMPFPGRHCDWCSAQKLCRITLISC